MQYTLKQLFEFSLTITGETIKSLAKKWGCTDAAIHRVAVGGSSSVKIEKLIIGYCEVALSANKVQESIEKLSCTLSCMQESEKSKTYKKSPKKLSCTQINKKNKVYEIDTTEVAA